MNTGEKIYNSKNYRMEIKMKKVLSRILSRAVIIGISIFIQLALWIGLIYLTGSYSDLLFGAMTSFSLFCMFYIVIQDTYNENKIAWIAFFFLFSVAGGIIYFTFGSHRISKRKKAIYNEVDATLEIAMEKVKNDAEGLLKDNIHVFRQTEYLKRIAKAPAHTNTEVEYFSLGEEKLNAMVAELKTAEKFIFLEYFIIEEGKMWGAIEEILIEKAAKGVDVRILYDDLGCLLTLPRNFAKRLAKYNIDCRVFNTFNNLFNSNFNNRDHRKICVIDGNIGFTGGINLADEYINEFEKHGHWKDTAIMLKGEAVYNLTAMFLSMWSSVTEKVEDFSKYAPTKTYKADGIIQPFGDSPLDNETVGETVYMSMLNRAKNYVYITTPYLIISRQMMVALTTAAKSGIDVRLILPGIADKKFVHFLSRSFYEELVKAGVKIYEYMPGFVHSKMFICDDESAVVGTINLDYRSLSLHYECGAFIYGSSVIGAIKEDFIKTQSKCVQITAHDYKNKGKLGLIKFTALGLLRTFAPLL